LGFALIPKSGWTSWIKSIDIDSQSWTKSWRCHLIAILKGWAIVGQMV